MKGTTGYYLGWETYIKADDKLQKIFLEVQVVTDF